MRFLNGTRVPRKQGVPLMTSGSLTITCSDMVSPYLSVWIDRWVRPYTPSPLLEVQINNAVLARLHLHPDVQVLLPRIVEPRAVCQRTEHRHFPVLAILELHARRPLHMVHHPLVIAILFRFDFQAHDVPCRSRVNLRVFGDVALQ